MDEVLEAHWGEVPESWGGVLEHSASVCGSWALVIGMVAAEFASVVRIADLGVAPYRNRVERWKTVLNMPSSSCQ